MSYGRLRNVAKFSISIGLAFLCIGIFLFLSNDAETKPEKMGTVFMMYSGIMLGIGFIALVALKSP
jgi:vacuolar-type H+-ATPase subunit I/STV1